MHATYRMPCGLQSDPLVTLRDRPVIPKMPTATTGVTATMINTLTYCMTATSRWSAPSSRLSAMMPAAPPAIIPKAAVARSTRENRASTSPANTLRVTVSTETPKIGTRCCPTEAIVVRSRYEPAVTPMTPCAAAAAGGETLRGGRKRSA